MKRYSEVAAAVHPGVFVAVMKLMVNGQSMEFEPPLTLEQLIERLEARAPRVATMVNEKIVKRAQREQWPLAEGDTVEIIQMVGGG